MSKLIKLKDLCQRTFPITVSEEEHIEGKPLTLDDMVNLFLEEKDHFLNLFGTAIDSSTSEQKTADILGPFLLSSPNLVAKVIAYSAMEKDSWQEVKTAMPATMQLIALADIWKASVPDPKKAGELLSGVMARLQKNSTANANNPRETSSQPASLAQ